VNDLFDLDLPCDDEPGRTRLLFQSVLVPFVHFLPEAWKLCSLIPYSPKEHDATDWEVLLPSIEEDFRERGGWLRSATASVHTADGISWIQVDADGVESFLQCLNDIRLSCWGRLGNPDPLPHIEKIDLNFRRFPEDKKVVLSVMELISHWQTVIVEKVNRFS